MPQPPPPPLHLRGREVPFGAKTYTMGIVNVTDDSFSGDGLRGSADAAVVQGLQFIADGADFLDVGGESTRPGSEPVPLQLELERVVPVVAALRRATDAFISVDTCKPEVARQALDVGADLVNDVYGLRADGMVEVCAAAGAAVCIMHMLGTPRDMQRAPHYDDVVADITAFLRERVAAAIYGGIPASQIVIDPGFGFGKTVAHNLELLRRLDDFAALGHPVLLGTSRKATIGKVLGDVPPEERLFGTAATCAIGVLKGAHILRVHDVREMAQVARMADSVMLGWEG